MDHCTGESGSRSRNSCNLRIDFSTSKLKPFGLGMALRSIAGVHRVLAPVRVSKLPGSQYRLRRFPVTSKQLAGTSTPLRVMNTVQARKSGSLVCRASSADDKWSQLKGKKVRNVGLVQHRPSRRLRASVKR